MVSGKMVGLRPRQELVEPAILAGVLSLPESQKYLDRNTTGMAESQVNFANEDLLATPVWLPPRMEQHRIAEILDTVDEVIRVTERLIEKSKAIKAGLLHDLLTRGINENGHVCESHSPNHVFIVEELGSWTGGGTPSKQHVLFWQNGVIPWVTPKDMGSPWISGAEQALTLKGVEAASLRVNQPGDVAVVFRSGILRHTFPVSSGKVPFVVNQDLKVLHPSADVDSRYAFHALCALSRQVIQQAVKSGTTVESVDLKTFLSIAVQIPGLPEQKRVAAVLDATDEYVSSASRSLGKLMLLKRGLMHDLLTGKVRVPIDEEGDDE